MKIQLITEKRISTSEWSNTVINHFDSPQSIDEFDLNIIDLSAPSLWYNDRNGTDSLNIFNDFASLRTIVQSSSESLVVYALPQNVHYHYYKISKEYCHSLPLKDLADNQLPRMLQQVLFPNVSHCFLQFENTRTQIDGIEYSADFFFTHCDPNTVLTISNRSKKPTTIRWDNSRIFATTLQIVSSKGNLMHYIDNVICPPQHSDQPDWFAKMQFADDLAQQHIIQEQNALIKKANDKIQDAEKKLNENKEYKSILYTNGDELVKVVYRILERLLESDLSKFVDEKKEDFLIEKTECTFIGEIKGVTSNVKNEHISQCDLHYSQYIDQLEELGVEKTVKQLLIMNPFRRIEPSKREPVHTSQINLAIRNNCLIIETAILLEVFELFLSSKISTKQCTTVLMNHSGLLSLDMFQ